MDKAAGRLVVTPDATTPGSEGRLYLQLPRDLAFLVGQSFKVFGNFSSDRVVMLVRDGGGNKTVTPNRQVWWKNGVRDHNIRENWAVNLYILENDILIAVLVRPTGETPPQLPPHQPTIF